ncbi:MAG: heterodisulfide reductase-related iron-sulfur binding cluster [Candidatus Bathyarchaeia archaeon]|nr:CoB--CoM heterodisulfide reductase subunit B [Candidatus Bathyarchaeota archaeon]
MTGREYAFFIGCTIQIRLPSVEVASKLVLERLGIKVHEMRDVSCCPEPYTAGLVGKELRLALGARNIAISDAMGLDILCICNGCYETLFEVKNALNENPEVKEEINENLLLPLKKEFKGMNQVKHVVEVLYEEVGLEKIKSQIVKPLTKLNVALHAGCHIYKASSVEESDKKPRMLEELVKATGAKLVDYGLEKLCCGYPQRQVDEKVALVETLATKLKEIMDSKADCIIVVCPGCHIQLEFGQIELKHKYGMAFQIPVLNLMELLAISMGFPYEKLGLEIHRISTKDLIKKLEG